MLLAASVSIPKEHLHKVHFVQHEVLDTPEKIAQRRRDLYRAMLLGNVHHGKVKIVFETSDGMANVETTIWYTSETSIALKGGATIPACCIHEVIF